MNLREDIRSMEHVQGIVKDIENEKKYPPQFICNQHSWDRIMKFQLKVELST
jgi:hypothetical protein